MSGRVAVVTGAASGIGLGVAQRLAADGNAVALLDRDGPGAERGGGRPLRSRVPCRRLRSRRGRPGARWSGAFASVRDAARAGHHPRHQCRHRSPSTPVADITPEKWDHILAVNLTGTFTCMQLAVPDMIADGWGRIVTISSSSAQSGAPHMAHYVASKGGVIGLTKAFAREFAGQGITVNTIPPTIVDTPMAGTPARSGDVPSIDDLGRMVPHRTGRDARRHRRHLRVPLFRRCGLHHRPGDRRERRHVHLSRRIRGGVRWWAGSRRGPRRRRSRCATPPEPRRMKVGTYR